MQKDAFDDVACKHLLLATSAARVLCKTSQRCQLSFMYHVKIEIIFSAVNYRRIIHGVDGQMLRRRELILRNLTSNTALFDDISQLKKYFLNNNYVMIL